MRPRRSGAWWAALLVAGTAGSACRRQGTPAVEGGSASTPATGAHAEVEALLAAGQLDQAAQRIESLPAGAESLYLQGLLWSKRSELAPLPTPLPAAPGTALRVPELKSEEVRAVQFFDQAAQADPRLVAAQLAAARLLAPHALRAYDQQAVARGRRGARGPAPAAAGPAPGEPDWSPAAVALRFQRAAESDGAGNDAVDALVEFAGRVGQADAAEAGLRELVRRQRESAEPLVRYGDFLLNVRREPLRAVEQYQQALIWKPDDAATKARLADIYIDQGIEHFKKREYMAAQVRFDEAGKYAKDPNSPQGLRLRDYVGRLREIRGGH